MKKKYYIDKETFTKIKEQSLIIDVRSKLEHQILSTLPNSINVPYENLITEPEKYIIDKNQLVITYCNYGNRSGQTAQKLREKGYLRAFVLRGGIYNNN
jgi:rhodanese-related sulfurtransferase